MGCASSRAADDGPLCARCHVPISACLVTGRYICHRCGRETTPLFPNSADEPPLLPRGNGGAIYRLRPNTPPAALDGMTCQVCRSQLPLGVVNCPYCGNLLGASASRPAEFQRPEDATNGNGNGGASSAAEMSRSPPAARDIALEDSDEALERLTNLLEPDRSTLREILRNLADNAPKFWPCPDCTFHNQLEAAACKICDRPAPPPSSDTKVEAEEIVPLRGCDKEGRTGKDGVDVALDAAIQSVCCPICLEVYHAPMTLPCGHSLCLHHCPHMKHRDCPICRAKFTSSQWRSAKNVALCRNVRTVVLLGSLQDPDRDTIRHARAKMRIGEEELSALKSALKRHRSDQSA